MTANKRFIIDVEETTQENALFENGKFVCFEDDTDEYLKKINELADGNERLKEQLQEFRVEKSNRINAFCVTNDEYSVVLLKENEAYMVCNMINRLIRSCK